MPRRTPAVDIILPTPAAMTSCSLRQSRRLKRRNNSGTVSPSLRGPSRWHLSLYWTAIQSIKICASGPKSPVLDMAKGWKVGLDGRLPSANCLLATVIRREYFSFFSASRAIRAGLAVMGRLGTLAPAERVLARSRLRQCDISRLTYDWQAGLTAVTSPHFVSPVLGFVIAKSTRSPVVLSLSSTGSASGGVEYRQNVGLREWGNWRGGFDQLLAKAC
jgi:hypothetical protein